VDEQVENLALVSHSALAHTRVKKVYRDTTPHRNTSRQLSRGFDTIYRAQVGAGLNLNPHSSSYPSDFSHLCTHCVHRTKTNQGGGDPSHGRPPSLLDLSEVVLDLGGREHLELLVRPHHAHLDVGMVHRALEALL